MAKPKTPRTDILALIDKLEIGQVYELTTDVQNPRSDKREKYDTKQKVAWKKGTRFVVQAVHGAVVDGLTDGIDPSKLPRRLNLVFSSRSHAKFQLHGYRFYCNEPLADGQAEARRIELVVEALRKVNERDWSFDDALALTGNSMHSSESLLRFLWERRRISRRDLEDFANWNPDEESETTGEKG